MHGDAAAIALTTIEADDAQLNDISQAQLDDSTIGPVLRAKREEQRPEASEIK